MQQGGQDSAQPTTDLREIMSQMLASSPLSNNLNFLKVSSSESGKHSASALSDSCSKAFSTVSG
jgi:hypothetical protein